MALRSAVLVALGVVLGACRIQPPTEPPEVAPAIALSPAGERLYFSDGIELRLREYASSSLLAIEGPCDRYLDLELWSGRLLALCSDGRVFEAPEPQAGVGLLDEDWSAVADTSALALQRSDGMVLAIAADGRRSVIASLSDPSNEALARIDRFRGPDRGSPDQLPIATFGDGMAAHAIALDRGPQIAAAWIDDAISCSIDLRGASVGDLAIGEDAFAAAIVDRSGRAWIVHVCQSPNHQAVLVAIDASGEPVRLAVDCKVS